MASYRIRGQPVAPTCRSQNIRGFCNSWRMMVIVVIQVTPQSIELQSRINTQASWKACNPFNRRPCKARHCHFTKGIKHKHPGVPCICSTRSYLRYQRHHLCSRQFRSFANDKNFCTLHCLHWRYGCTKQITQQFIQEFIQQTTQSIAQEFLPPTSLPTKQGIASALSMILTKMAIAMATRFSFITSSSLKWPENDFS